MAGDRDAEFLNLVVVSNSAYNLGWDMPTLVKFAGSCHYKK